MSVIYNHVINIMNSNETIDANHYTSLHKMHVQLVNLLLNQLQYFNTHNIYLLTTTVVINSINVQI